MKKLTVNKILEIVNSYNEGKKWTIEQIDEDITELGIDSIMFVQIVVSLEEYYEIEFPDEKISNEEMNTIRKIYDVLKWVILEKV